MANESRPSSSAPDQAETILLVDDDATNLQVLYQTLQGRRYKLLIAKSGEQALTMARRSQPAVILLDIVMPGIDGYETCRQLKADPVTQEAAVIFLSSLDDTTDKVRGFERGAVDYITKPFQAEEVIARVNTHVTIHRLQQRLIERNEELDTANRFIRQIFGRYVSDEVVASVLDQPEGLQMGGEERKVTLLMSDLRGFTAFSERLTPTQVVAFLNRYFEAMIDVIMTYNGTIDEIVGDALLVLFGAPISHEDDAQRAVACAVAMQLAMAQVNAQSRHEGLPEMEMGIGIHTGEVVIGNIGSYKRTKYSAVGSNINLTGRIESYTTGGQILVSDATCREVSPSLRFGQQIDIEPKGAKEHVTVHEITGIGEPYKLFLPDHGEPLVSLATPLGLRLAALEDKHVSSTVATGQLLKLSNKGADIHSELPVPVWSNVKIWLTDDHGTDLSGDLYAKVIGHTSEQATDLQVRFTSMAPDVRACVQECLRVNREARSRDIEE